MHPTRRFLILAFCSAAAHLHAQTLVERLTPFVESHALAGAVTAVATSNAVVQINALHFCADEFAGGLTRSLKKRTTEGRASGGSSWPPGWMSATTGAPTLEA